VDLLLQRALAIHRRPAVRFAHRLRGSSPPRVSSLSTMPVHGSSSS
jgi:hypothetical protein